MPHDAYRERVFAPDDVRRILRRAAELEDGARRPSGKGRGHTLAEIEQIASDAGISEDALRRALAGDVAPPPPPRRPWSLAGAPARISLARTVSASSIAAVRGELARAMRRALGEEADERSSGGSLRGSISSAGGRRVVVIVEPEGDGRVAIRAEEDLRPLRAALGGTAALTAAIGMLLVVALAAAVVPASVPYVFLAWCGIALAVARGAHVRHVRARELQLQALVLEVAALVEAPPLRVAPEPAVAGGVRVHDAEADEREDGELASEADERRMRART